jgi:4-hydroxy-tetrahydrodipicolinate synthase
VLGVLVLPPFYYKAPPRAGLVAYYDAVLTPLADGETFALFYDFPRLAGVTVGTDLVREIAVRHGTVIAGVKDSSGDIASVEAYCRALKACDALAARAVFPGTEAVLVDALAAGASGLISATANLGAPLLRAVLAAWHAGDRVEALRLQAEAVAFREPFERAGMIPALKAELARRRGDPGWRRVRPPWTEMPEPVSPAAETSVGGTGR